MCSCVRACVRACVCVCVCIVVVVVCFLFIGFLLECVDQMVYLQSMYSEEKKMKKQTKKPWL